MPLHCFETIIYLFHCFAPLHHSSLEAGFPGGSVVENLPGGAEDVGSIPGLERSPGEGNGNPIQNSCLENPMDRGDWRAAVHGSLKDSDTT